MEPSPFLLLTDLTASLQQTASDGSQACAIAVTSTAVIAATNSRSPEKDECPHDCPCNCHRPSRGAQLIPSFLRSWCGQLHVPHTLSAAFWPSLIPCDHTKCVRGRQQVQNIKYTVPQWFAHVEATIRFEALPIHLCIQTPRVVPSLLYLHTISFDELKIKLSTRELTLCDVESDGRSVLHVSLQNARRSRG